MGDHQSFWTLVKRGFGSAARSESWFLGFLRMGIIAGPLTYLGLQIGYRMGYGRSAPGEVYRYFAAYTISVWIISALFRFLFRMITARHRDLTKRTLSDARHKLIRAIRFSRNRYIDNLPEAVRERTLAYYLLASPRALPDEVYQALVLLKSPPEVARLFETREIYRLRGLPLGDVEEIPRSVQRFIDRVQEEHSIVFELIKRRWAGRSLGVLRGRKRTPGFLDRAYQAASEDNPDLITSMDCAEIFILVSEILMDRPLTLMRPRFSGKSAFYRTAQHYFSKRRQFQRMNYRFQNQARDFFRRVQLAGLGFKESNVFLEPMEQLWEHWSQIEESVLSGTTGFWRSRKWESGRGRKKLLQQWENLSRQRVKVRSQESLLKGYRESFDSIVLELDEPVPIRFGSRRDGLIVSISDFQCSGRFRRRLARRVSEELESLSFGMSDRELKVMALKVMSLLQDQLLLEREDMRFALEILPSPNLMTFPAHLSRMGVAQELERLNREAEQSPVDIIDTLISRYETFVPVRLDWDERRRFDHLLGLSPKEGLRALDET